MALITLRQLLDHAAEHNYALPAFNVNNLEYIQAVMRAADATDLSGHPAGKPRRPRLCR